MKPSVALTLLALGFLRSPQVIQADAFLLNNGVYTAINVPGAIPGHTVAQGINDTGQIVGYFDDNTGRHGFLDTNGVFTKFDFPGSASTEAFGINDAGQIVGGFVSSGNPFPETFLDSHGVFSAITIPGSLDQSSANGINKLGQIVGLAVFRLMSGTIEQSGFIDTNGNFSIITLPSTFNVAFSEADGINDSGQVVGVYFVGPHGFLDSNGTFSSIDVSRAALTWAKGINDSGQIVGYFAEQENAQRQGFLDTGGVFTTIDVPGSLSTFALGINDAGEVVGSFGPAAQATPEPASLVLLTLGLAGIVILIVRRRMTRTRI